MVFLMVDPATTKPPSVALLRFNAACVPLVSAAEPELHYKLKQWMRSWGYSYDIAMVNVTTFEVGVHI